jgi:hypothetical protein
VNTFDRVDFIVVIFAFLIMDSNSVFRRKAMDCWFLRESDRKTGSSRRPRPYGRAPVPPREPFSAEFGPPAIESVSQLRGAGQTSSEVAVGLISDRTVCDLVTTFLAIVLRRYPEQPPDSILFRFGDLMQELRLCLSDSEHVASGLFELLFDGMRMLSGDRLVASQSTELCELVCNALFLPY